MVFFADAPSTLSFALEGARVPGVTLSVWRSAREYKAAWAPMGLEGNGMLALQQDLPVQLRARTYGQFYLYTNGFGAKFQNDTACLIPQAQSGSCSPLGLTNEFGGGSEGDCASGGTCFGYLAGRFWTTPPVSFIPRRKSGLYDIEFTHEAVTSVTTAGAFTLIKN